METTPFKVSHVEDLTVITLLVESINARNAHWIKDELIYFIREHHPKSLFVNLYNVRHIGHIGLGCLIAINNQIKTLHPHAFMGLQPEVNQLIVASHLENVFLIWTAAQPCPICHENGCIHKAELQRRTSEFLSKNHPIDESQIPHLGEHQEHQPIPHPRPFIPLDMQVSNPAPTHKVMTYGLAALIGFVLIAGISAGTFVAAQTYFAQPRRADLTEADMLVRYDKNGDEKLDRADLPLMTSAERVALTFSPWCAPLGLTCGAGARD